MVRALDWVAEPPTLRLIDQTRLPLHREFLDVRTVDALVDAIATLAVRGAPALGACGAFGVAIAMIQADAEGWDAARLAPEVDRIRDARPTAVNLAWGVDQVRPLMADGVDAVVAAAAKLTADDTAANRELSRLGADWLLTRTGKTRLRALTHCNTGALATTGWGTAYGILRELHERGALEVVYADETRPLLQGSRLTSFELSEDGIPHVVQVDGAATSTILRGLVDFAVTGADRIAANGDSANKIGTVGVALACQRAGIPFLIAAPFSTVDLGTATGDDIVIEERPDAEVLSLGGVQVAPDGVRAFNPAFDVTPHDLISAVVTELGIVEPDAAADERRMARLLG